MEKTYIIIVNYNGWKDTIECLKSILEIKDNFEIIVVDNCSKNNSIEQIEEWCQKTNIKFLIVKKEKEQFYFNSKTNYNIRVALIKNNENRGFSAGNNVGINFALQQNDADYFWFLNNDTIIENRALQNMILFLRKNNLDITSSIICYHNNKELIQAIGTYIDKPYFHMPRLGDGVNIHNLDQIKLNKIYSFPGASFLLSKKGLEKIGNKFDESYDFYYEEAELGANFREKDLKYDFCRDSIIWHKGGASFSDNFFGIYHMTRSQMIFVKRHFPKYLIFVISYSVLRIIKALSLFKIKKAKTILKGIVDGLLYK